MRLTAPLCIGLAAVVVVVTQLALEPVTAALVVAAAVELTQALLVQEEALRLTLAVMA